MDINSNKTPLIIFGVAVLIIVAAIIGYRYYQKLPASQSNYTQDNLSKQSAEGVLPSIDPRSNPLEKAPDINPVSKTNPYSGVKTNPFK